MIDDIAEWDAAYVLGALSLGDRHTYEDYLAANPECAAALTELACLPGILNVLSCDEAIALTEHARDPSADGGTLERVWQPRPPSRSGPERSAPRRLPDPARRPRAWRCGRCSRRRRAESVPRLP